MSRIELVNLRKEYGSVVAVNSMDLTIEDGEFIVFVGPSGCGKTTTLRMIAGFEDPTAGEIRIDGDVVNEKEPGDRDLGMVAMEDVKVVTERQPSEQELNDLLFAWEVAKYVKSNAIVYAKAGRTIGVGAGQMSRVYSAKIAGIKAADEGLEVKGSVMASDAFFPFRDGIDAAAAAGITAVIQPGGSMRDQEVIDAANEHGIAMVFTGMRHFRH